MAKKRDSFSVSIPSSTAAAYTWPLVEELAILARRSDASSPRSAWYPLVLPGPETCPFSKGNAPNGKKLDGIENSYTEISGPATIPKTSRAVGRAVATVMESVMEAVVEAEARGVGPRDDLQLLLEAVDASRREALGQTRGPLPQFVYPHRWASTALAYATRRFRELMRTRKSLSLPPSRSLPCSSKRLLERAGC